MLIADAVWKHARKTNQDTDKTIDGVMAVRNLGASVRRSRRVPSGAAKIGWAIRPAQPMAAVARVWQGITAIRDPYTNAARPDRSR